LGSFCLSQYFKARQLNGSMNTMPPLVNARGDTAPLIPGNQYVGCKKNHPLSLQRQPHQQKQLLQPCAPRIVVVALAPSRIGTTPQVQMRPHHTPQFKAS
jgi:hypothetical protein